MAYSDDPSELPPGGMARVRLFPLPNLVLFPHVLQPLHIFEPRYRQLLEDALAADKLIATVLLEPGWEADYEGRPPIRSTACVGRVVSHSREGDGRHNILLLGVRRARIQSELVNQRPYREAEVRLVRDIYSHDSASERPLLTSRLLDRFRRFLPTSTAFQEQFEQLLNSQLPLGVLTDIVAFTMNLELRLKQQLLEQLDVDRRAAMLLQRLRELQSDTRKAPARKFPPDFSSN